MPLSETATAVLRATDWMAADPRHEPALLAAVLRLDLPDPYRVATDAAATSTLAGELIALSSGHRAVWDGDPVALLDTLGHVGAQAWLQDPDNVPAWSVVADRGTALTQIAMTWPYRFATGNWAKTTGPRIVAAFLDAGRGPSYANDILTAAERAKVAPDAFGYGDDITPATLVGLAAANIRSQDDLEPYLEAGLPVAEALKLAERQVAPAAVHWAVRTGMPVDQWDQLAGLPGRWFPVTHGHDGGRGGLTPHGYTVEDMHFLLDSGWQGLSGNDASHGMSFGGYRRSAGLAPATARLLAQVCSKADFEAWVQALTAGKGSSGPQDATLPPLMRAGVGDITSFAPVITELLEAGLRPSHLNTFRAAGCRTVADVLAAHAAGVTPKRAKVLLETSGTRSQTHRPLRIGSVQLLLAAHRAVAADATSAAPAPSQGAGTEKEPAVRTRKARSAAGSHP